MEANSSKTIATTTPKKVAVVAGCNYHNIPKIPALNGCIHDAHLMQKTLIERFGFEPNNIELLTDDQKDNKKTPTRPNIYRSLVQMVREAKPRDLLVFCFSGHGTVIPPDYSPTKRQEQAIFTYDSNVITSIDFRILVEKVPKGAIFMILADSCNSGGLIDKEKEQIGPHHNPPPSNISHQERAKFASWGQVLSAQTSIAGLARQRMVLFETVLNHLTSVTGLNMNCPDNIGQNMLQVFGPEHTSAIFRLAPDRFPKRLGPEHGILISGCQADELSEEGIVHGNGTVRGFFTYALNEALKEHRGPVTNKQLVIRVRELVKEMNKDQHPCLYCSDKNVNDVFMLELKRN